MSKQPFRRAAIPKGSETSVVLSNADETLENDVIQKIYRLLIDGKKPSEIAEIENMSVGTVNRYINLGLAKSQESMVSMVGSYNVIAYERIERYVIVPMIQEIQKAESFNPQPYEILMKGIKAQADLFKAKIGTLNLTQNNQTNILTSGSNLYQDIVEIMRDDLPEDELSDMRIPRNVEANS